MILRWTMLSIALTSGFLFSSVTFATENNMKLPIDSEEVYSISVKPNKAQGANVYTLKIYSNDREKAPTVNLTHPLSGQIHNVEIRDIDKDGQDELIITTVHTTSSSKTHHDIYEFSSKTLFGQFNEIIPVSKMFKLFE